MDLFFVKKNPSRRTPNGFHNYVPFWRYRKEDKNDWYLIHNIHVLYTCTYIFKLYSSLVINTASIIINWMTTTVEKES